MTFFARARSFALFLGISASGCKIPAFEGSDICSGLVAGDTLNISIDTLASSVTGSPLVLCDARLGLDLGNSLSAAISENGEDGCGTAIGPLSIPESQFDVQFDLAGSRNEQSSRDYWFANASSVVGEECAGKLTVRLYNVDPTVIGEVATGTLGVTYVAGPEGAASCPAECDTGFLVSLNKPADGGN